MPASICAKRGAPDPDRRKKTIFPTAAADQNYDAAASLPVIGASSALLEQRKLARLGQRQAIDQLGDHAPRPKRRRREGRPKRAGSTIARESVMAGSNLLMLALLAGVLRQNVPIQIGHLARDALDAYARCKPRKGGRSQAQLSQIYRLT